MKALRIVGIGKPLEEREMPLPDPGIGEILLRVKAAGICHSDAHYRAGTSPTGPLPVTPGHEVAGIVDRLGPGVSSVRPGDRVAIHYQLACGDCRFCRMGQEQFCPAGAMVGKHRDGGYAEYLLVPARNAVPVPEEVPLDHAAVMMCSTATSFHALRKARLAPGETVAVFGLGGLGMSAVQLARALGAREVFGVDLDPAKLRQAERYGAVPVNAGSGDPVAEIRRLTGGAGVDVALELIGLAATMEQAVRCLGVFGRAALAGIGQNPMSVHAYSEVIGKETEIIGVSDHLMSELPLLLELAKRGRLDLSDVVTRRVPLRAAEVNRVLDELDRYAAPARTVIVPEIA